MERAAFPYSVYDENHTSLFKKKIPLGFIYTMNVDEQALKEWSYDSVLKATEDHFGRIFGTTETLYVTDTYQFNDYSKYVVTLFDEAHKAKRRKEHFPKDCQKSFEMGARLATT